MDDWLSPPSCCRWVRCRQGAPLSSLTSARLCCPKRCSFVLFMYFLINAARRAPVGDIDYAVFGCASRGQPCSGITCIPAEMETIGPDTPPVRSCSGTSGVGFVSFPVKLDSSVFIYSINNLRKMCGCGGQRNYLCLKSSFNKTRQESSILCCGEMPLFSGVW